MNFIEIHLMHSSSKQQELISSAIVHLYPQELPWNYRSMWKYIVYVEMHFSVPFSISSFHPTTAVLFSFILTLNKYQHSGKVNVSLNVSWIKKVAVQHWTLTSQKASCPWMHQQEEFKKQSLFTTSFSCHSITLSEKYGCCIVH